jgi:hypothetical protein
VVREGVVGAEADAGVGGLRSFVLRVPDRLRALHLLGVYEGMAGRCELCCEMQYRGDQPSTIHGVAAWVAARLISPARRRGSPLLRRWGGLQLSDLLFPTPELAWSLCALRRSRLFSSCYAVLALVTISPAADHHRAPGSGAWTSPKAPRETASTKGLGITSRRPGRGKA